MASRKNISSLMFDIRPVDKKGNLDLNKIGFRNIRKITPATTSVKPAFPFKENHFFYQENALALGGQAKNKIEKTAKKTPHFGENLIFKKPSPETFIKVSVAEKNLPKLATADFFPKETKKEIKKDFSFEKKTVFKKNRPKNFIKIKIARFKEFFFHKLGEFKDIFFNLPLKKIVLFPLSISLAIMLTIAGVNFFQEILIVKNSAEANGQKALINLVTAKEKLESRDFNSAALSFQQAYAEFSLISKEIANLGGGLVETARFIPYFSKISSGSELTKAGENIAQAGIIFSDLAQNLSQQKEALNQPQISFLEIFQNTQQQSQEIAVLLERAQENIQRVNVGDLPQDHQEKFLKLKDKLPEALNLIRSLKGNEEIFTEILGGNGPRKYLFLFQNNHEMRATGGFIGSYGVLNIFNGRVKNFFIDGIFNPDGQLKEKIVPPAPIQKISASWSLHDSNWFPDFPVSAEKAIWFYEKTGGPTVDGVITMTPSVMQKLLEITGPIALPEYQITIDRDNFSEKIQEEVEINYDKELNQPKKILADLTPLILDRLFNSQDFSQMGKIFKVMEESVKERQILIYARNYAVEKTISAMGCSGEILKTDKDYLSVINSNINGYKTDGVMEQSVKHETEIKADGSIQDTVTITRKHLGGNSAYEWWNKVNADYMRVYVPEGSALLSVEGQTREFNSPPLDYKLLGFKQDPQVRQEEDSMEIDPESGTRIYSDAGKTVFANWVYVSPQEETVIKYSYILPFKIRLEEKNNSLGTYSLLFQKQAGSLEENFTSRIIYPADFSLSWAYPEGLENKETENILTRSLEKIKTDQFIGAAFVKK